MRSRIIIFLMSCFVLPGLSSCSYIKSWFPDKTRDYLDSSSLPPLKIPTDLGGDYNSDSQQTENQLQPLETQASTKTQSDSENKSIPTPAVNPTPAKQDETTKNPTPPETVSEQIPAIDPKSMNTELQKDKNGIDYLQINAPLTTSWRLVNKALGHQSIEVTARNQNESVYIIQYDPNATKPKDESTWDEMVFMFKGVMGNEKEYRIKLLETNQQTQVYVETKDKHSASSEISLKFLTDLQKTIKSNLAV